MDRRTFFYIGLLVASFFLVQYWFAPTSTKTKIEDELRSKIEIDSSLGRAHPLSPQEKSDWEIVPLYSDVSGKELATYAVLRDFSYLTTAWDSNMPSVLYVPTAEKGFQRAKLKLVPTSSGDAVLYSLYPTNKLLLPHVPSVGEYEVFYISTQKGEKTPTVIPGRALGKSKLLFGERPEKDGILIFGYEGTFWPLAVYNASEDQVNYLHIDEDFAEGSIEVFPQKQEFKTEESQKYYVLENDYQQIVFSTADGAISEINLPFETKDNQKSVVHPIDFDRIMKEHYPSNARFPQANFQMVEADGKLSASLDPKVGGYYPLLRRNVYARGDYPSTVIPPHYFALNVIRGYAAPEIFAYTLQNITKDSITLVSDQASRRITKTFSFPKNVQDAPYCVDVTIKIEGDGRGMITIPGIPEVELISNSADPMLKYRTFRNGKPKTDKIKPPKSIIDYSTSRPDWICNGNGFFGLVLDPLNFKPNGFSVHPVSGFVAPTRLTVIDARYNRFPSDKYPGYSMHLPLENGSGTYKMRLYAGPFDRGILKRVDTTFTDPATGKSPDYSSCQSSGGWFSFISEPFAKFLYILLSFFYKLTHSWGFSIILLTIALRLMLYPLNNWSIKSTLKMQQIAPQVKKIQDKYKKDPKRAQMEIMQLYRSKGANPFGGCFPMLIQLPFLIGMYNLLRTTFELRGASFIPGWINNLAAPDIVLRWHYPIPFFGNSLHLLPILLGVVMYIQQKFSSTSTAGATPTDQQRQQKFMGNMMVIIFTVLFYHFPSGLNIYWLSSMLLGILQQWWTMKRMKGRNERVG